MPRLVGKQAALYLNIAGTWSYVADLYDWTLDTEMVTLDASIKGDAAERYVISHSRGRLSGKRYVQAGGTFVAGDLITSGVRFDWAIVALDTIPPTVGGFTTNTSAKAQGTGYITRFHAAAPRGMVQEDFELTVDTLPVIS